VIGDVQTPKNNAKLTGSSDQIADGQAARVAAKGKKDPVLVRNYNNITSNKVPGGAGKPKF